MNKKYLIRNALLIFTITLSTIGQHDATNGPSGSGPFRLAGGFWANSAAAVTGDALFKDSIEGN